MVVVVLLFCSKLSGNQPSENRRLQSIIRSKMVKLDLKTDYYWLPLTPLKNLKWCFYSKQNQHVSVCKQPYWAYLKLTHGVNNLPNLPLPAIAYYINTLDSQSCRGAGVADILTGCLTSQWSFCLPWYAKGIHVT